MIGWRGQRVIRGIDLHQDTGAQGAGIVGWHSARKQNGGEAKDPDMQGLARSCLISLCSLFFTRGIAPYRKLVLQSMSSCKLLANKFAVLLPCRTSLLLISTHQPIQIRYIHSSQTGLGLPQYVLTFPHMGQPSPKVQWLSSSTSRPP